MLHLTIKHALASLIKCKQPQFPTLPMQQTLPLFQPSAVILAHLRQFARTYRPQSVAPITRA